MVTITYGHGYLNECNATGTLADTGADGTQTIAYGDRLELFGRANAAGNEYCEVTYDPTNVSPVLYPHYLVRWMTTATAAPGMGANCFVTYTDASTEFLVGTLTAPAFNAQWTVTSGTLSPPAGESIDTLTFMISDSPDALDDGTTGYAYFDFALVYAGTFTLPNVAHGMHWTPGVRDVYLPVPGRVTDITQRLGSEGATCTLGCDLDQGAWTATGYANYPGELFDFIAHRSYTEPWQWVTGLKERSMKATVHPAFTYEGGRQRLDLELREYSLGTKSVDTHAERWNIT